MILVKKIFFIFIILALQSCSYKISNNNFVTDCLNTSTEVSKRHQLFKNLSTKEIQRRKSISLPSVSKLSDESVVSHIFNSIKNTPKDAEYILVDLRYYRAVDLINIVFSTESDFTLTPYLFTSKYSQGFFSLINFNNSSITFLPPQVLKIFKPEKIFRPDLVGKEIIINASNANSIFGNLKFSPNFQFSILADNVTKPIRLDLREASNMQFNLNRKWIMQVYSLENSNTDLGKVTTGFIKYINNKNSKLYLQKFYKTQDKCYVDNNLRFNIIN
ncbi:MAG: hypothetical protein ACKO46_05205 [Alphaproteobacteria bacterium]